MHTVFTQAYVICWHFCWSAVRQLCYRVYSTSSQKSLLQPAKGALRSSCALEIDRHRISRLRRHTFPSTHQFFLGSPLLSSLILAVYSSRISPVGTDLMRGILLSCLFSFPGRVCRRSRCIIARRRYRDFVSGDTTEMYIKWTKLNFTIDSPNLRLLLLKQLL